MINMASGISPLPADVVNLIAAGEVIDSLAAVVRELAENALDAGATRIAVALWTDQWRIRVADNGTGMTLTDLQQAALPHSTSKIRAGEDLNRITSLGFRGEALHSLAQLADLEICSRSAEAEGWQIHYTHEGSPDHLEPIAMAPGTVVTVSHLFGQWLSRRQGLPPMSQQLRLIQTTIYHLALCHPHLTWQVQQNDRDWFIIAASASAQQILPQLLRDIHPTDLQILTLPTLSLLLGLPDRCHRHRPDWIKVAVNGRVVKFPELEQTIMAALRRTLPRDRYPVCFVHLHLPPDQVDWNRHPAKAEIYLHHLPEWQQQVTEAIDQALHLNPTSRSEITYTSRIGTLIKTAEAQGSYGEIKPDRNDPNREESLEESDLTILAPEFAKDGIQTANSKLQNPLLSLRALAQVHHMYILAEHPTGMWLVEQHIAHERVLYEQLCDRWQMYPLETPIILSQLTVSQQEQLQRIGIDIEPFGENLWAVRSAPASLVERADCAEALIELSLGGNLDAALVATACRTAIRNGTPLSLQDMQTLLDQWQQTRSPRTCPHGRPIYLSLEESSLSRFFRRHWVIGKSHGI